MSEDMSEDVGEGEGVGEGVGEGALHSPDTVSEAVALLVALGYDANLDISPDGVHWVGHDQPHPLAEAVVDHAFRFEGESDPGDEAIVLGVSCPGWGIRGVVVSAFGPGADRATAELFRR